MWTALYEAGGLFLACLFVCGLITVTHTMRLLQVIFSGIHNDVDNEAIGSEYRRWRLLILKWLWFIHVSVTRVLCSYVVCYLHDMALERGYAIAPCICHCIALVISWYPSWFPCIHGDFLEPMVISDLLRISPCVDVVMYIPESTLKSRGEVYLFLG